VRGGAVSRKVRVNLPEGSDDNVVQLRPTDTPAETRIDRTQRSPLAPRRR
jgi:hypothetical protein